MMSDEHVVLTSFGTTWDQAKIGSSSHLRCEKSWFDHPEECHGAKQNGFSGPQQMKLFRHIHTANKMITINSFQGERVGRSWQRFVLLVHQLPH